jgi:O-Antigen ligase
MATDYRYRIDKFGLSLVLVSGVILTSFMDPINWPKQIALLCIIPIILNNLRISFSAIKHYPVANKLLIVFGVSCTLVALASLGSILFEDASITRTLWGLWGRNNGLLTMLSLFFVSASITIFSLQKDYINRFFRSLELGSIVFLAYGFLQLLGIDPVNWSKQGEVFSFFGNTNFASAVFSLSASTFLALAFFETSPTALRLLRVFLFLATIYLLIETKSIQGLAGLLITITLLTYVKVGLKKKIQKVIFFIFSTLLGAVLFIGTLGYGPFGSLIAQYTLQLRFQYWLVGLKIGNLSPVWGVGADSFGDYYRTQRPEELALKTSIDLTTNNAHNVFVQQYATLGILGLLAVLIPVALGIYFTFKILLADEPLNMDKVVVILFVSLWSIAFFSIDNIAIAVWNYAFLGLTFGVFLKLRLSASLTQLSLQMKTNKNKFNGTRYLATVMSIVMFTCSWFASYPDRKSLSFMANPVNTSDANLVSVRSREILNLSVNPFVMETQYWNLASELNKIQVSNELFDLLNNAIEEYPRDFNLLDLSALYREQRGFTQEAIKFRRTQLEIDPRHPRVWLSYAYDLKAIGKLEEARRAFEKVKEFDKFLSQDIKSQMSEIEKEFSVQK